MNALNCSIILTICLIIAFSHATQNVTQRQVFRSHGLNQTQDHLDACTYVAEIYTSCGSIFSARGQFDLVFGDANGYQVFVPQLPGFFEDCTTHTYDIHGACAPRICLVDIYWRGVGGWILEKVTIHSSSYDAVTFHYNTYIPVGGPFGFNYCR